jgi:hypothetical protein
MMHSAARLAEFWRVLARVRGLRVQRRLHAMVDARRRERRASAEVAACVSALEQHADERLRVLTFCRRDQTSGRQWHATLRAHDERIPVLRQQLAEAERAYAAACDEAAQALLNWRRETMRQDEANARARESLIRLRDSR